MRIKLSTALIFLGSFWFYLRHVAPSVTTGDSGEFIATSATLSLAHAPSYPLFTLIGRFFIELIPWGAISFRINLLSAVFAALNIVLMAKIARMLGVKVVFSYLIAGFYGVTTSFWLHSLVTEVFQLHIFTSLLLISILIKVSRMPERGESFGWPLLFVFVLGFGLGNHQTLILFIPSFLFVVTYRKMWGSFLARSHWLILFGILGFTINLMLPIRSAKNPPLNWGKPTTLNKFYRTLARKDYGSFSLALGESPKRNVSNSSKQILRFGKQLAYEVSPFLMFFLLIGFLLALYRDPVLMGALGVLFLMTGPGFYLLGNLPFTAQSEGIMGRFFMLPTLVLCFGWIGFGPLLKKGMPALVFLFVLFLGVKGYAEASSHRDHFLVRDYGKAMFKTLPPGSALFMDGGDDAFYSLAMLQYAEKRRPDLKLHDRGGLIFSNPYGSDFRKIGPNAKKERRWIVEKNVLKTKRVFYSSMNPDILPGATYTQAGFLIEANGQDKKVISWPLISLRGLYPLKTSDYRTRALGAFFPFMQGKQYLDKGNLEPALAFFYRAQVMGFDIDWLKKNLGHIYEKLAFDKLENGELDLAEAIYLRWIGYDDSNPQAYNNLGVVYEKRNDWDQALKIYEKSMNKFSKDPQAAYNLSVYYWKKKDWKTVVSYLSEVLRRDPNHENAKRYIEIARRNLN